MPWTVQDTITVDGAAAFLTLDAGLELQFAADAWLEVGDVLLEIDGRAALATRRDDVALLDLDVSQPRELVLVA